MPLIGIDPGLHTGVAVAIRGKLVKVESMGFWDCINLIRDMRHMGVVVRIEDPGKISAMYSRPESERCVDAARNKEAYRSKMAQYVGMNKRDAQLIIEFCKRQGIACIPQKPLRGATSKIDAETFNRYTGWQGKTNEHGRDAAMQIFGFVEGCE